MTAAKIFLAIVAVAYFGLALWCALKPHTTANSLGLVLKPGSGESEYTTVYGGFQFALALLFLLPFWRAELLAPMLLMCLVLHGSLVLFRTISFAFYPGISNMTYGFAASEWVLALLAAWFVYSTRP